MVSMLASSAIDRRFEPQSGQTKDYKIGICCFSAKHTTLRRKRMIMMYIFVFLYCNMNALFSFDLFIMYATAKNYEIIYIDTKYCTL
jgi:hypothetical protein